MNLRALLPAAFTALSLAAASVSAGTLKFADVLTDHAVLQRDVAAPVWGKAAPGAEVTVALNGKTVAKTTADANGRWRANLPAQPANAKPSILAASAGGEKVALADILFGDVWFGCGQSNMAYTFNGYGRLPVGGEAFVAQASNTLIRTLMMNTPNAGLVQEDAPGVQWRVSDPADPESVKNVGAALYWFGDKLHKAIGVPVGLVNASWGATRIDAWLDPAYILTKEADPVTAGYAQWYEGRRKRWIDEGGRETYKQTLYDWNQRFNPGANFLSWSPFFPKGAPTLHDLAFDDSAFATVTLPISGFQSDPFPTNMSGEVWMRATFVLEKDDLHAHQLGIRYRESYGNDMTYVNGHAVGGSGNPNHGYGLPVEHLLEGTNVLVVQFKVWGYDAKNQRQGGMHNPPVVFRRSVWDKPITTWKVGIPKEVPGRNEKAPDNPENVNMFSLCSMHCGRVAPLYPMAIKGAVWYQGCSDLGNWKYPGYFRSLVGGWRANFTYGDKLPVIVTEICPYKNDDRVPGDKPQWSVLADMRAMLMKVGREVPDCETVSLLDLGEDDIHPLRKEAVGERWCRNALARVYGRDIASSGPQVTRVEWTGSKVVIHFRNAEGLKSRDGKPLAGFELSGPKTRNDKGKDEHDFRFANARIVGETVEVSCDQVAEADALRYAWFDKPMDYVNPEWNLVNADGLPCGTLLLERPIQP